MDKVTLGGDRLGAGKKMQVELDDFQRSNHDLGFIFRTTMSPGTLVPFFNEVALPGDTFEINLNPKILTHPTVGPLFGSYKVQCDVFSIPMRLYIPVLHNNPINIGLKMNTIKLPQVKISAPDVLEEFGNISTQQVNPSSLLAYLGVRSFGHNPELGNFNKSFNAIPLLAYFDIFKNFYANKQLDKAFIIHSSQENSRGYITAYSYRATLITGNYVEGGSASVDDYTFDLSTSYSYKSALKEQYLRIHGTNLYDKYMNLRCTVKKSSVDYDYEGDLLQFFDITYQDDTFIEYKLKYEPEFAGVDNSFELRNITVSTKTNLDKLGIDLQEFDLINLDTMREKILQYTGSEPFNFGNLPTNSIKLRPYDYMFDTYTGGEPEEHIPAMLSCSQNQEGLLVKCYQNDLYNNWLREETFVGAGSIEELTRIDTTAGYFSIDQFRLSNKVNIMLNRIAVSGGDYKSTIEAVWNINARLNSETPKFEGGCFQDIVFSEVVNNSGTPDQPLGSLAGRGHNNTDQKGGHIVIHVNEPSYIMGIVSITPKIDYCQANKWDINLQTLDDLHKPQLDQIGFQDQLTENMAAVTSQGNATGVNTFKAVGKVPAWINYMSNVNQVFGNFALEDNEMFMVMTRRYNIEKTVGEFTNYDISDLTTYIDPTKFNYMFAQTSLDSMNFWTQIGIDINKRSVMSYKIMPNL